MEINYTPKPEENEDLVVIFTIGDKKMLMSQKEYDFHLSDGRSNPVLIGDVLHLVSNKDFKIIKKIEKII